MSVRRAGRVTIRYFFPPLILAAAGAVAFVLIRTPPSVNRTTRVIPAPVVGVAELKKQDASVFVEATGTVRPAREVRIQPEVGGRVVSLHPNLVLGGLVREGETLFKIDPSDYDVSLKQAEALRSVAAIQIERLQAAVEALEKDAERLEAQLIYARWNTSRLVELSEQGTAGEVEARDAKARLAAQEAALGAIRARVTEQEKMVESAAASRDSADSDVDAARLALERTEVTAPFDAIVIFESVERGQLVGPQTSVARLVATDAFWVVASVPIARLPDIRFPASGEAADAEPNVTVTLSDGSNDGKGIVRRGHTLRALGELDPDGRMARVLVAIDDPLGLSSDGDARKILLGSYVHVQIESGILRDVYAVPRRALRENDRIWVRDAEGLLQIRTIDVLWRRLDDVLARGGLEPNDLVVTTRLTSVIPGMPLDIREPDKPAEPAGQPSVAALPETASNQ